MTETTKVELSFYETVGSEEPTMTLYCDWIDIVNGRLRLGFLEEDCVSREAIYEFTGWDRQDPYTILPKFKDGIVTTLETTYEVVDIDLISVH